MEESISGFFEQWTEEFARAIEMFNGERPAVSHKSADLAEAADWEARRSEFHWCQMETEGTPKFKLWMGAPEECYKALGGGDGDPKEMFQEMLSTAGQGAVAVLSSSFRTPVKFGALAVGEPSPLSALLLAQIAVVYQTAELPALMLALEPAAAKILAGPGTALETALAVSPPASAAPPVLASMLDRLMDLHLPVSVILGQTTMPIRDILKITSGTLIELDRQLGEYVEVVVHGTVVARGEIVAIKGNYGIRIKQVISRQDRFALKNAA